MEKMMSDEDKVLIKDQLTPEESARLQALLDKYNSRQK